MRGLATVGRIALLPSLAACAGGPDDAATERAPRCVGTGIADPESITVEVEPRNVRDCRDVPRELLAPGGAALYERSEAPVGTLRCTGFPPGEARVRVRLRVRLAPAVHHAPGMCRCGIWRVIVGATANGGSPLGIPPLAGLADDESCRAGPDHDGEYRAPVGPDGSLTLRFVLHECDAFGPTRCLFARGTAITAEPAR